MSTPKTPKPAKGSADAHRDGKDSVGGSDDEPEEEMADIPAGAGGGGGGGGLGGLGGGGGGDGGSGGIDLGINARTIAIGAGVLIVGYFAYKRFVDNGGVTSRSTPTRDTSDPEESADGGVDEQVNVPNDPNDPLKADDAAGDAIFDGWGE